MIGTVPAPRDSVRVPLTYRPDIDGLRALAVLAVIGFHAFPRWIPGGFVGVDVFFVISGFLISSIILSGLDHGRFSFVEFYSRRIRRIFPALLVILVFGYALGWFALLADEYKQLGKHIAGAAAFASNFVLWRESGYFDNAVETKPLLHLWSLGVEEQFYVVWPLVLYVAWRRRQALFLVILAALAGSFWLNIHTMRSDAVAAFYSPVTRLWELLIGGAFACRSAKLDRAASRLLSGYKSTTALRDSVSVLGCMLIVGAALGLSKGTAFPGWWALVPTFGALLLITAGKDAWLNRAVFSRPIVVWIGAISYPLYLWHWLLLSFATIISTDHTVPKEIRIAAILASVALATLTFRLVERPIRLGRSGWVTVFCLCALMLCVGSAGFWTNRRDGIPSRIGVNQDDPNNRSVRLARIEQPNVIDCSSEVRPFAKSSYCASTGTPNVALIGDSHASHLFYGFLNSGDDWFSKVILIGAGSCWPTLDAEVRADCNKQLLIALDIIRRSATVEYVVLAGYYLVIDKADSAFARRFFDGYVKTFDVLHAMGKRIVFVIDPPTLKSDAESCMRRRPIESLFPRFFLKPAFCLGAEPDDLRSHAEYDMFVDALRKADADVLFYNPADVLCVNHSCKVFDSQQLLYWDWNHLSTHGSRYVARDLIARVRLDR